MPDSTMAPTGKKRLRLEIEQQLTQSLAHLKEIFGEKKFSNKIKGAAKLLTKGLKQEHTIKKAEKEEQPQQVKTKPVKAKVPAKGELTPKAKAVVGATPEAKKVIRKKVAGNVE